jgi:hypothetical protein
MSDFVSKCARILSENWTYVTKRLTEAPTFNAIEEVKLLEAISRSVNSKTKSYRYVLPTQLVAKMADPSLDSRCIQASRGGSGCFDARSVCDEVVVPFDRDNHNVLGGAPEPYVNNPLRVPEVSAGHRERQKDKKGWDDLIFVLQEIEKKRAPHFTTQVFQQTLIEIHRRLSVVKVAYPTPKRISLKQTEWLVTQYLSAQSGGERVLTITTALVGVMGERFQLFSEIRRRSITAADASSGLVADIECLDAKGRIQLAVEVKDRELVLNHVASKLPDIRAKKVSEILFIAQKGISKKNGKKIEELVEKEFSSGQNIYIFGDVLYFSSGILALLGEDGRRKFLENVGMNLDQYGAAIQHKKDWADLLARI